MKRLLLILALLVTPACHAPVTIVTPAGQAAYRADVVIQRLTDVSNFVKAATGNQPGNISYADAFTIIEWISGDSKAVPPTIGVAQIVANAPGQDWKTNAKASWTARIRPLLMKYPKLAAYVPTVDALLEVI